MIETNIYGDIEDLAEVIPPAHSSLAYSSGLVSWTKGLGEQSLLIYSKTSINFKPLDGLTYSGAYTNFSVAYRGRGSSVYVSGIDLSLGMYFYVYAFNGVQTTEKYNREIISLYVPPPVIGGLLNLDGTPLLNLDGTPLLNLT
jgi:hypothetical protein